MTGNREEIGAAETFKGHEGKLLTFMVTWSSDYLREEITSRAKKLIQLPIT